MTFLAPAYLIGALVVAGGIVLLHFIVTKQPTSSVFPTARFVPELPAKATSRAARPSDLLLMLLRVLVVIAAGAGLARPVAQPSRVALGQIILADVSRGVASVQEVADSIRVSAGKGAIILAFDSTSRRINGRAADSISRLKPTDTKGNLSSTLISAARAASDLRDKVDSIELVIVSPFADEEADAATTEIRSLWPGRARLIHVSARARQNEEPSVGVIGDAADPLRITTGVISRKSGTVSVRVLRNGSVDGTRETGVTVAWPSDARPPLAVARRTVDSSGAVVTRNSVVVALFQRRWSYPADSLRGATVVARWVDGEPAAIETPKDANTCTRSIAIPVTSTGDLPIRPEFTRLVGDLTSPCGDIRSTLPISREAMLALRGGASLAPASAFAARSDVPSPLAPWLLGLALLGAIAELFVRSRTSAPVESAGIARERSEAKAA
ncbi:MAG TPA: BatA domain-containing protein [Gemmatimonadaceae bacterium]